MFLECEIDSTNAALDCFYEVVQYIYVFMFEFLTKICVIIIPCSMENQFEPELLKRFDTFVLKSMGQTWRTHFKNNGTFAILMRHWRFALK